ncbi:glycosyltransferase family 4 protein [Candidatus Uhrbacteria bacterium]|nr:glycosyltransferase family 4 protein [Candidatus Uhrbacteria bacterium]
MRIILANKFYYPRGGAETYLLSLSYWLSAHGHEVIPFAMQHPENLQTPFAKYFVSQINTDAHQPLSWLERLHTFGRMMYSLEARRNMATLIFHEHPDLCHIHNIYTQISPSILDTLSDQRVPVVMTVHDHHLISPQYNIWAAGCGPDRRKVGLVRGTLSRFHQHSYAASFAQVAAYKLHRALKLYARGVKLFITPSAYLKRQLVAGGFPSEHIHVNPYGIDTRTIAPHYEHDGSFLYVGRLSEEKGVELIVTIAKLLPDLRFKIVGRGPHMEFLHRLAIGVDNVEFLGFRSGEELNMLYRNACALLVPSRVHEVFPLTILEAMAYGKPVIASHVGGIPEIVQDRSNGFLVSPTDVYGWTEAILRLAYDQTLQQNFSRSARASVEEQFRLDDHYRRLLTIYQEVMPRQG